MFLLPFLHSKLPKTINRPSFSVNLDHCYCIVQNSIVLFAFLLSFLVISSNLNNNRRRQEYSVVYWKYLFEHYFFILQQSDLNRRSPYIHTFPNRKKRSLYPSFWRNMLKWSNTDNFLRFSWKFIIPFVKYIIMYQHTTYVSCHILWVHHECSEW